MPAAGRPRSATLVLAAATKVGRSEVPAALPVGRRQRHQLHPEGDPGVAEKFYSV